MTAGHVRELLREANGLPLGAVRIAACEHVRGEAERVGDPVLIFDTLCDLATAYGFGGGDPRRKIAAVAAMVSLMDTTPALAGDHQRRRSLLWRLKWVTVSPLGYPEVPLDRVREMLDDMQRRYLAAGEGLAPVLRNRYRFSRTVHGPEAAHDDYLAWVRAPRTDLSDCAACEHTSRVEQLADLGHDEQAVHEALPVLDGRVSCTMEPERAIGYAMVPLLRTGRAERAAVEHLRAVANLVRKKPWRLVAVAEHISVCARVGRLDRGLKLVEAVLPLLDYDIEPHSRMLLAAHASRLLRALVESGRADLPVHRGHPPRISSLSPLPQPVVPTSTTAGALADLLTAEARSIAARFGTRDGTTVAIDEVERILAADPLPVLPLERVSRAGRRTA